MTGTKDRNKRNTKAIIIPVAIIGTVLVITIFFVLLLIDIRIIESELPFQLPETLSSVPIRSIFFT